jgi:hypothetical protein
MPTARTSVFISYSHADSQWLRLLNTHLKPLVRDQKLQIWSDQKIRKGERWRDRIHKQMAMARVGIFLVSADFLASDFIHAEELPPLLKAANQEGATLLTIIVRPCGGAFQDSPLSQLQAMNGPQAPLSGMTKTQREQVMVEVYNELRGLFRGPAASLSAKPQPSAARSKAAPKKKQGLAAPKDAAPKRKPTAAKAVTAKPPAKATTRPKPASATKPKPATSKKTGNAATATPKPAATRATLATKAPRKPAVGRKATTRPKK